MGIIAKQISYKLQKVKDSLPNHERKLETYYEVLDKIGSGISGSVHLGKKKNSGKIVALKMIHREKSTPREIDNEISVLRKCKKATNVNHLLDVFYGGKTVTLVLQYFNDGTLWNTMKKNRFMKEQDVKPIMRDLLQTLTYLHNHGTAHRDIKPQNIVLHKDEKGNTSANLIDFGFATNDGPRMNLACGSLPFAAPELLGGQTYTNKVDVWSLGVIMFTMFMGQTPFLGVEKEKVRKTIVMGILDKPIEKWTNVPELAQDLLDRMLTVVPEKRITADQALNHPWFSSTTPSTTPMESPRATGSN